MRQILTTRLFAFASAPCTTLGCKLGTWLHVLYLLAVVLAIVLIMVTLAAVKFYRENKKAKITPE